MPFSCREAVFVSEVTFISCLLCAKTFEDISPLILRVDLGVEVPKAPWLCEKGAGTKTRVQGGRSRVVLTVPGRQRPVRLNVRRTEV